MKDDRALGCNADQLATARLRADTLAADVAEVNAAVTSAAEQKAEVDLLIASLPPGDRRDKAQAVSDKLGKGIAVATEWLDKAEKSLSSRVFSPWDVPTVSS